MEYKYSIELALFDFIPVLLSAIGLILVAKLIGKLDSKVETLAKVSVGLIVAGGLCKAVWKLLVASADVNLIWLNHALFIFMAPGFTLLTYAMWAARKTLTKQYISTSSIKFPISMIVITFIVAGSCAMLWPDKRFWFISFLVLLTLSNIGFIWQIVGYAWQHNAKLSAGLFVLSLIGIFVMTGLARVGDQGEAAQWVAEFTNTFNQFVFALGAWLLIKNNTYLEKQI